MIGSAPLPFTLYPLPAGTSLAAHLGPGENRCGVYVLTYQDVSKYVGQSVDVVGRCADHLRHAAAGGERIVSVHFASVPQDQLASTERKVVGWCEHQGMTLRNKLLTGMSVGPSKLNAVVREAAQQAFLADETPEVPPEAWFRAPSAAAPRRHTRALLEHPDAAEALDALAFYLLYALPDPAGTEGRYWMLTAPFQKMPSGARALARLTVQNVETLVVLHDEQGTYVKVNLAPYPVLPAGYEGLVTEHYTSNGPMQTVDLYADGVVSALSTDPVFRAAARRAAVGLMRKGVCAQGHHHDRALADTVYAHIHELTKEPA